MDSPKDDGGRAGIQALDSALVVLRVLAALPGPAPLSEIARQSNMPSSKVHRYLSSFMNAGLVQQAQRAGQYDLGKGAMELGLAALARVDFVNDAADALEELAQKTGTAALVAVWGPRGPTVVRWQRSNSFVVAALGLGTTLPLLNSASGRVYLAYSSPGLFARLLDEEVARSRELNLRWPDLDPRRDGDVERLVERVRGDGYAAVDGRFIPGLYAVSAPVLNWQGEVEAAITLNSGDPSLLSPGTGAIELLSETCRRLSLTLPGQT